MKGLLVPSTVGGRQLEGSHKFVHILELVSTGEDLVDHILDTDDTVLADGVLDDVVVSDGLPLLVDVDVPSLVDKLPHGLQVGVTVGDVRFDQPQHLAGRLVQTNEHTVVDLPQTEKLEDLPGLGIDSIDTTDTDDERHLSLGLPVEVAALLRLAAKKDPRPLQLPVLRNVLLGTLEVFLLVGRALGLERGITSSTLGLDGIEALALLQCAFGDGGVLCVARGGEERDKRDKRREREKRREFWFDLGLVWKKRVRKKKERKKGGEEGGRGDIERKKERNKRRKKRKKKKEGIKTKIEKKNSTQREKKTKERNRIKKNAFTTPKKKKKKKKHNEAKEEVNKELKERSNYFLIVLCSKESFSKEKKGKGDRSPSKTLEKNNTKKKTKNQQERKREGKGRREGEKGEKEKGERKGIKSKETLTPSCL